LSIKTELPTAYKLQILMKYKLKVDASEKLCPVPTSLLREKFTCRNEKNKN